jgi:hypothetical protein
MQIRILYVYVSGYVIRQRQPVIYVIYPPYVCEGRVCVLPTHTSVLPIYVLIYAQFMAYISPCVVDPAVYLWIYAFIHHRSMDPCELKNTWLWIGFIFSLFQICNVYSHIYVYAVYRRHQYLNMYALRQA